MTPMPSTLLSGHAWLGRLGHFSRRGALVLGGVVLAVALVVIFRAAAATRENLAFDAAPHRDAATQLRDRAASVRRSLEILPARDLLARYARPKVQAKPAPPPVVAAAPEPTPAEILRRWRLSGVMEQGGQPVAVLNQKIVSVGDEVEGFHVTAIAETYVDLKDKEGRSHRLDLYDHLPGAGNLRPQATP